MVRRVFHECKLDLPPAFVANPGAVDSDVSDWLRCSLNALHEYGYSAVCLNVTSMGRLPPKPFDPAILTICKSMQGGLRYYTRVTLVLDEPSQNYGLTFKNAVVRSFDVVAVQPQSEKLFQMACQSMDIDVISFDVHSADRLPFALKHGFVREAVERGVFFELPLGALFTALDKKRMMALANAMAVCRITKGRNTIISHGSHCRQYRGPHDLANVAKLVGIPSHFALATVRGGPQRLLERVATRKFSHRGALVDMTSDEDCGGSDLRADFLAFISPASVS